MEECSNFSLLLVKHLNKNRLLPAVFHLAVEYNANLFLGTKPLENMEAFLFCTDKFRINRRCFMNFSYSMIFI